MFFRRYERLLVYLLDPIYLMRTCGYIGHLKRMVAMEISGDVFQFSLFGRIGVRLILGMGS
jgi:hypothetical protein